MARRIFVFDDPDRFVAGAIGPPGQRAFFLQAVEGRRVTSVSLEKVQVALLADRVAAIVAELQQRGIPGVADLRRPRPSSVTTNGRSTSRSATRSAPARSPSPGMARSPR